MSRKRSFLPTVDGSTLESRDMLSAVGVTTHRHAPPVVEVQYPTVPVVNPAGAHEFGARRVVGTARRVIQTKVAPARRAVPTRVAPVYSPPPATTPPAGFAGWLDPNQAWGDHLNTSTGLATCTPAAEANIEFLQSTVAGHPVRIPDSAIVAQYVRVGGYNGTPASDAGEDPARAAADWVAYGFAGSDGAVHKSEAFGPVNYANPADIQKGVYLYGAVEIGFALPASAEQQFLDHRTWDVVPGPDGGIAEYHVAAAVAYNSTGPLLATWGQTVQTTWAFVQRYGVLAYASMTPDWIGNGGVAINGLNNAQLLQRIYTLSV